ncbi:hypothetical protein [Micromonospora foliorum]|uniref:hypothetical protein n=1 Tax=Micromonospora foliorum TaxID=2911210 RepID=UPI001EE99322|nr:hypothetical protein [Micromonospora foliorum]MCG5439251.1 hypothetical protein [Micromonospora foliorum]
MHYVLRHISKSDPYASILAWWGEPLTIELIRRVERAPAQHFAQFHRDHAEYSPSGDVVPLDEGELRPLMLPSYLHDSDRGYGLPGPPSGMLNRYFGAAMTLLLYSHQVMMQDPLMSVDGTPREIKRRSLEVFDVLLTAKPLADANALIFIQKRSIAQHPSTALGHFKDADWQSPAGVRCDRELNQLRALRADPASMTRDVSASQALIGAGINVSKKWPGSCSLLARSSVEDALLRFVFERAGTVIDGRERHLQKLAAISVPNISMNVRDLTSLRASSDEFAEWREVLAAALREIHGLPDGDGSWAREARGVVYGELAPAREKLQKAAMQSPAMAAAKKGVRDFTLSGIGTLGGAIAGGKIAPALIGAATGKIAEVALEYLKAKRAQRQARAILDITVSFVQQA